eukprot:scaffold36288_cov19-Tisochrysis_lutea.AAC.1
MECFTSTGPPSAFAGAVALYGPGGAPYGSPARARAQGGRAAGKVWPDRVWWSCLPIGWSGCVVAASARSSVQEVSQHQHSTCGKICHYSLIFLKQEGAHEFLEMIRAPSALEHLMVLSMPTGMLSIYL